MAKNKKDRGSALKERLDSASKDEESAETTKSEETAKRVETSKRSKTEKADNTAETSKSSGTTVRERKNVNMYLPEDLVEELAIRFDELNAQYRRKYGEPMEKNRDFYPALVRTALESGDIEEELGLES